jgi:hypothetical protein
LALVAYIAQINIENFRLLGLAIANFEMDRKMKLCIACGR